MKRKLSVGYIMCHQNTRQNYNKIANTFFENVKKFKYLKIAVTNQT